MISKKVSNLFIYDMYVYIILNRILIVLIIKYKFNFDLIVIENIYI